MGGVIKSSFIKSPLKARKFAHKIFNVKLIVKDIRKERQAGPLRVGGKRWQKIVKVIY
jgi:hypothetical protein